MKKSHYAAWLLGGAACVLFALGMCMALVSEWGMLRPGAALGGAGLALGLAAIVVWRRMEHRPPVRVSARAAATAAVAILGALALGTGMCLCMVWGRMAAGIAVGLAGLAVPAAVIPLVRGLRD